MLNAILCREGLDEESLCRAERWGTASSEFENDWGDGPFATTDEEDWNDVELFTRRVHPVKPYIRHLRYRDEGVA